MLDLTKYYARQKKEGTTHLNFLRKINKMRLPPEHGLTKRYERASTAIIPVCEKIAPLLDVGCRDGRCLLHFMDRGFVDVQGVDISMEGLRIAKENKLKVSFMDAHDLSDFPDAQFGVVLMLHSLEHCYAPGKVVQEVWRILKSPGFFYIEVPGRFNDAPVDRSTILQGKVVEVTFSEQELKRLVSPPFELSHFTSLYQEAKGRRDIGFTVLLKKP